MKIADGMGIRKNFRRYSYLDEMKMDAVEDCLKGIKNFSVEKAQKPGKTVNDVEKSGKINAFGYFSQVVFWAFIRRINKEKKEQEGRKKYIIASGAENFIQGEPQEIMAYLDELKSRIDADAKAKEQDNEKHDTRIEHAVPKARHQKIVDSNLNNYFIED
jgi:hypothetical protein